MSETSDKLKAYYDKLFQDGFLMVVSISVWGMGAKLDEDDLGIEHELPDIFQLGKKMLIDPKHLNVFKRQESKIRRFLYANSLEFPIADAHFVSKAKMLEVWEKLEVYKAEFLKLVDTFLDNYDDYKQDMLDKYANIKERLIPFYPGKGQLRDKFGVSITTFELSVPRQMEITDLKSVKAQSDAEKEIQKKLEAQMEQQYAAATKKLEQFTEQAALALRQQIVNICKQIAEKIQKKEILSNTNIATIKEEIINFKSLNFLDDRVVSAEIDKLQALVEGNHNFKSDGEAIDSLNNALENVLRRAANTSDIESISGNYFRKINI